MPVTNTVTVVSYAGNNSSVTPYPLDEIERDRDEELFLQIDGVDSSDFTISPDGLQTGTAIPNTSTLVIFRETNRTQEQPFPSNTTPAAEDVRAAVDKLTLIAQEIGEEANRSIKPPIGGTFGASSTVGLDANGNPISRTAEEEVAHLGVKAIFDSANVASAAATTAAATAVTNAAASTSSATAAANSATAAAASAALALEPQAPLQLTENPSNDDFGSISGILFPDATVPEFHRIEDLDLGGGVLVPQYSSAPDGNTFPASRIYYDGTQLLLQHHTGGAAFPSSLWRSDPCSLEVAQNPSLASGWRPLLDAGAGQPTGTPIIAYTPSTTGYTAVVTNGGEKTYWVNQGTLAFPDWQPVESEFPLSSFPDSTPFDFIGFYEDFTIRPNGQSVGNGITAPIVGGDPYQESYNGPAAGSFVTEGGGLRVPVLSNNYLGSSIYTPNGVLDVTFDLLSFNPTNEVNTTGFTFTFKNTPVVNGIGLAQVSSTIAPSESIHINFDSNGSIIASHFQQSTPVTIISQGENSYQWPMRSLGGTAGSTDGGNTRWRVNMRAYGDRLEVTSRGRTIVIQCAAIAENIGAEKTYFYFQTSRTELAGFPPAAVRNYTRLERMWANAPALSLRAAVGGSYGSVFDGHPHARYPNKIDVRPGNRPLIGNGSNQSRIFTRTFFVGGATAVNNVFGASTYQNGGFYVEGKSFHSNLTTNGQPVTFPLNMVRAFTSPVASPANASITTPALLALSDGSGFIGASPGVMIVDELCGTFGANNNPKRIQIRDNTLILDSGEITQNGGAWRITIRRSSLTTVSNNYFVEFWSQTTGILFVNASRNLNGAFLPINLFASGVAAGDVTVSFRRAIATQDNN